MVVFTAVIAGSVAFFKRRGKQEMQTKQPFIDPNKQKYFVIYNWNWNELSFVLISAKSPESSKYNSLLIYISCTNILNAADKDKEVHSF